MDTILTAKEIKVLRAFLESDSYKKGYETERGYFSGIETRNLKKQSSEIQSIFSKLNDSKYKCKYIISTQLKGLNNYKYQVTKQLRDSIKPVKPVKQVKQATKKQLELLSELKRVLGNELDFGFVGKKKRYSAKEASKLISLNKDIGFGIIEGGQCTIPQYETLTLLAGRKPKLERYLIGHGQAAEWIKKYTGRDKKVAV